MNDPTVEMIAKIIGEPISELVYPRVLFSLILPLTVNFILFYGLMVKLRIFGRGTTNSVIGAVLSVLFCYFIIRLKFVGYAVACMGIGFVYFRNDFARLGFVLVMVVLYFGLQFLV